MLVNSQFIHSLDTYETPVDQKKAQPKSWGLCFIQWTCWGLKPGNSLSDSFEGFFLRGKGGARLYINRSLKKKTNSQNIERLLLKKTKHLKSMNLVLFYGWEDTGVWVHWNHSFDIHLTYLGPVSCLSPSWIPSGRTVKAATGWWLDGPQHPLFADVTGDLLCPYLLYVSHNILGTWHWTVGILNKPHPRLCGASIQWRNSLPIWTSSILTTLWSRFFHWCYFPGEKVEAQRY